MIEIKTIIGNDTYTIDPDNQKVYKNGVFVPSAELTYSNFDEDDVPQISGIYLRDRNVLVSMSGVISPVTDTDQIK